jgi:hypothetical protein
MTEVKKEQLAKLNGEIKELNKNQGVHLKDGNGTLDRLVKLQTDHKNLQKDNRRTNETRRQDMEKLETNNNAFDKAQTESNVERKNLRDKIADLEDTLRKIRD